jgi:hypothetical protein
MNSLTIIAAMRAALQWRLLLLWTICQLIPTAIVALPVWQLSGDLFDHSVRAGELAQRLDLLSLPEIMAAFQHNGLALGTASAVALLVALLLSPFQSALVIAAARAPVTADFATLASGALAGYGRMLRLLIWAVMPLGAALALGAAALKAAAGHNEALTLQADAQRVTILAMVAAALLFFIADATLDAGRAVLAADGQRVSALKAWWSGLGLLLRRPVAAFGAYGLISVAGLLLVAVLGLLRLNLPHADMAGAVAAFIVTQVMVAALAWMRSARLFALIDLFTPFAPFASVAPTTPLAPLTPSAHRGDPARR